MWIITVHIWWRLLIAMFSQNTVLQMFPCTSVPLQKYCPLLHSHVWLLSTWHHTITLTFVGLLYIAYVYSISTLFCNSTACVNKSASLKEHFFLEKLYVNLEKVYNNMIGNIISFYRIFVLCNLDVWFRNYGKSCEVTPNLFGLIH